MPIKIYLSILLILNLVNFIKIESNNKIINRRKIAPIKPKIEVYVVKIKSVLASGK